MSNTIDLVESLLNCPIYKKKEDKLRSNKKEIKLKHFNLTAFSLIKYFKKHLKKIFVADYN